MLSLPVLLYGMLNIFRTFFFNLADFSHLHLLEDAYIISCILKYMQL